jgi:hypothetical protein
MLTLKNTLEALKFLFVEAVGFDCHSWSLPGLLSSFFTK